MRKNKILAFIIILLVLIIDQISKIWIKTNMMLYTEFPVIGDWFIIHFTENAGMAWGLEINHQYGKLMLTIFRILAVAGLSYYMLNLFKQKISTGVIISLSLITSGALGNIIDSIFYGVIFSDSYHQVATMFPDAGGYAPWFHGKVVDMLYFPLVSGFYPDWIPFLGGKYFEFFRPVFNIADCAITSGVVLALFYQKEIFGTEQKATEQNPEMAPQNMAENFDANNQPDLSQEAKFSENTEQMGDDKAPDNQPDK